MPPVPPTQQLPPVTPTQQVPTGAFPGPATGAFPGAAAKKANLWRQATSTTGGRWATAIAVGALACLLLLGVAFAVFAFTRHDQVGPTAGRPGTVAGQKGGQGGAPGGRGSRNSPNGPGAPRGLLPRSIPGLGALHGEITVTGSDGKPVVMLVQQGEVTAVSATSISVKSSDGFTGTYVIDSTSAPAGRRAARLAKGDQVALMARKSDKVLTQVGARAAQRVLAQ